MRGEHTGQVGVGICCLCILALALISTSSLADSWYGTVITNSSSYIINRQGITFSLHFEESTKGVISPLKLTTRGRTESGYHSRYANVKANEVVLKERTHAEEGALKYAEITDLRATAESDVSREIAKKKGENLYVIEFSEDWPVVLKSGRRISYIGTGINDRDYGGNNLDFAGTGFLYNTNLERERYYRMILRDLNVTVLVVNESRREYITAVDFMPVRQLRYQASSVSTGIADFKYGQASQDQLSLIKGRVTYDRQAQQRYDGRITMNVTLNATTWQNKTLVNQTWLGACEICGPDLDLSGEEAYLMLLNQSPTMN